MSNALPWFQLNAARWLADRRIKYLTAEQRSWLHDLRCEAWESEPVGTLPADPDLLWKMARASSRKRFEKLCKPVLDIFELHDGRYFDPELIDQHDKASLKHERNRDAALKGARARWRDKQSAADMPTALPTALPVPLPTAQTRDANKNRTEKTEQRRSDAFPGTRKWEAEQRRAAAQADMERFLKKGVRHG